MSEDERQQACMHDACRQPTGEVMMIVHKQNVQINTVSACGCHRSHDLCRQKAIALALATNSCMHPALSYQVFLVLFLKAEVDMACRVGALRLRDPVAGRSSRRQIFLSSSLSSHACMVASKEFRPTHQSTACRDRKRMIGLCNMKSSQYEIGHFDCACSTQEINFAKKKIVSRSKFN